MYLSRDNFQNDGPQDRHLEPAIAAMHGPHSVFDIGTVLAMVCRWLTNEKQRKTDRRITDQ